MKIEKNMSLDLLTEAMGPDATRKEARIMRELLVEKFDGCDTRDIPENEWLGLIDKTVEILDARRREGALDRRKLKFDLDFNLVAGEQKFYSVTELRWWAYRLFKNYDGDYLDEVVEQVVSYVLSHDEYRYYGGYGRYVDMTKIFPDKATFLKIAFDGIYD